MRRPFGSLPILPAVCAALALSFSVRVPPARALQRIPWPEVAPIEARGLAWDGEALWGLRGGRLARFDPQTGSEIGGFPTRLLLGIQDGPGLAWNEPYLELMSIGTIYRYDPVSGTRAGSYRLPGDSGIPKTFLWLNGEQWVLYSGNRSYIAHINRPDQTLGRRLFLPLGPYTGLAWDGEAFWVSTHVGRKVLRINPVDGSVLESHGLGFIPGALTWDGHFLWISGETCLPYDITGQPVEVIKSTGLFALPVLSSPRDIEFGRGSLWNAGGPASTIYRFNPLAYGAVVQTFGTPTDEVWGIALVGDRLFTTDPYRGLLHRLSAVDGTVEQTFDLPIDRPTAIDGNSGTLWAVSAVETLLYNVDPDDGRILGTLPSAGVLPWGVTTDERSLWLTDNGSAGLNHVSMESGRTIGNYLLPFGSPTAIAYDNDSRTFWVVEPQARLAYEFPRPNTSLELLDFAANIEGSRISLSWKFGDESATPHCSVERRSNEDETSIRLGDAHAENGVYRYDDTSADPGLIYYYRVTASPGDAPALSFGPLAVPFHFSYETPTRRFPGPRLQILGIDPNPFQDQTTLRFEAGTSRSVTLRIFDISGRLLRELTSASGGERRSLTWDGRTEDGPATPSGIYFWRLENGLGGSATGRFIRIR